MNAAAKLVGFAAVLAVVFLLGLGLGRGVAPGDDEAPSTTTVPHDVHEAGAP